LNIRRRSSRTHDNVPARANAVAYFRVVGRLLPLVDAVDSVVNVERFLEAMSQISHTTLRSVLGRADLDMLLAERERLNEDRNPSALQLRYLQTLGDFSSSENATVVFAVPMDLVQGAGAMRR
jgi:hypothetical protein